MMSDKPTCKRLLKASMLEEQIRQEFEKRQNHEQDIDNGYFDDDEVESYLHFLIREHANDWSVIEDRPSKLNKKR